jgi:hypothetical protein
MSELSRQNPALWISKVLKNRTGRQGLSTIEMDALAGGDAAAAEPVEQPRRKRRTAQDEPLPKMPRITRGYGAGLTPLVYSEKPAGASEAEIEDRELVDAAMAIKDPWKGDTPPLFSPRPRSSN